MKRKATLPELVQELQAESMKKLDLVIPSSCMKMIDGDLVVTNTAKSEDLDSLLKDAGIGTIEGMEAEMVVRQMQLKVMDSCHSSLSSKLNIPKKYYDRMKSDHTFLLDQNVTYWLENQPKNYFLRTFVDKDEMKGYARALLSDRFKVIDNYDVLLACLEAVKESGMNITIETCDLTERKMYVRFVAPTIEIEAPALLKHYKVPNGSPNEGRTGICTGFVISNSEIGYGQFSISPRVFISACSNGMVFHDDAFNKTHLGEKMDSYSSIDWSEETKRKNYELIIAQVKDAIKTFCSEEYLGKKISQLQEAGERDLNNPIDAINNVVTALAISEDKQDDILNYFIKGSDTSAFGLSQALTYFAHQDADADEQFELEKQSVNILNHIEEYDKPVVQKTVAEVANSN